MRRDCLVLAGGLATRMRPATDAVPKALLPVAGEPFAVHQLRWLASEGVDRVVMSIGHLGGQIREALGARSDLGVAVDFVDEGDRRLGTGGAVRFAVDEGALGEEFLVLYGDSWLQVDITAVEAAHRASGLEALMVVHRNEGRWDTSNVVFDGRRIVRYDKHEAEPAAAGMHYIDYGLSVLRSSTVAQRIPADEPSDLATLFNGLSLEGRLAGYEAGQRFFEIGSRDGWIELDRHLAR